MGDINVDLNPKLTKSLKIYIQEHNLSENEVIEKALDLFFDGEYTEFWDDLYPKAVEVSKKYDKVSAHLLQRELQIGYARACRMIEQLEKDRLVVSK